MGLESDGKLVEPKVWTERLKLFIAIFGVLSPLIAGAAFFGLQPEKRKSLGMGVRCEKHFG